MKMYEDYLCEMGTGGALVQAFSAYVIFTRAKGLMNTLFSRAARQCSTIIDNKEKNTCILRAKIKSMEVELSEINRMRGKCADADCRKRVANRYLYLRNSIQDKKDQYNKLVG